MALDAAGQDATDPPAALGGALRQAVKSCSRLPGVQEIFLPGEQSEQRAAAALQAGHLDIDDQLFQRFQE